MHRSSTAYKQNTPKMNELTGVPWIIVILRIMTFLSAVWTLMLRTAPIHCRGSIGEQVM